MKQGCENNFTRNLDVWELWMEAYISSLTFQQKTHSQLRLNSVAMNNNGNHHFRWYYREELTKKWDTKAFMWRLQKHKIDSFKSLSVGLLSVLSHGMRQSLYEYTNDVYRSAKRKVCYMDKLGAKTCFFGVWGGKL